MQTENQVVGTILEIGETQTVGAAGTFKKRVLVVKTSENYPQELPIEFVQDKVDLLDGHKIGENVTVSINLRGSEYQGKRYLSCQGWKVYKTSPSVPEQGYKEQLPNPAEDFEAPEDDGLPF